MSAVLAPPAPATSPPPRATVAPAPWKWSRADYYRLGELGFFHGKRVELIRGEIVQMSPIGGLHAMGVLLVADAFARAFGAGSHVRAQSPLRLAGSEPQPDIAVVTGVPRDYPDHPTTALLVVEVSDSTFDTDMTTKAELYAEAGIADYWVLDLSARVLHVLRDPRPLPPGGHAYQSVTVLAAADAVAPLAAAGPTVRVADLLP